MLPQERKDLVEWFLEIKNDDKVKNKYEFVSKKFEEKYKKPAPHRNVIRYNINKWDKFASLETRQKGTPHRRPVLTENNINLVNDFVKNSKDFTSVRDIERETGIKRQSVHNILTQELKLFPYKVQIGQKLSPNSEVKRKKFSEIMLEKIESDPRYLDNIWFTDESHFHIDGYVNKQNMRIWGSENPNVVLEKSAHPIYVTVWAAISTRGIIGPYFFENSKGIRETVRQENYQQMIENFFVPKLKELTGEEFENQIFMQDGASPHTAKATLELLRKYFGDRIISYKTENFWPPNSPDLNPCDFYLWGHTKDRVFREKPKNIEDLKLKIIKVFSEIDKETLKKVVNNLIFRFKSCIINNGKHFANILKQKL